VWGAHSGQSVAVVVDRNVRAAWAVTASCTVPAVRGIVLSIGLMAFVAAGCTDSRTPEASPTTSASPETTGTEPTTTTSATPEEASQTSDEAHRDSVVAAVAALGRSDRIDLHASVDAPEGTWALSQLTEAFLQSVPDGCVGDVDGVEGTDFICGSEYGEILLLNDGGEILRAYPMPRTPPSWIYLSPDAIYAGHVGDGGLPSSTLVRIDRQTLVSEVVVFPHPDSSGTWPPTWHVATDDEAAGLAELVRIGPDEPGTAAISDIGPVAIDERALADFFGAS
jgi:hypothetical protein